MIHFIPVDMLLGSDTLSQDNLTGCTLPACPIKKSVLHSARLTRVLEQNKKSPNHCQQVDVEDLLEHPKCWELPISYELPCNVEHSLVLRANADIQENGNYHVERFFLCVLAEIKICRFHQSKRVFL